MEEEGQLVARDRDLLYTGGPFDCKDPRSLISIMPEDAKRTVLNSPSHYFHLSESELEAAVKPSARLNQIRLAWWKEYEAAQSSLSKMSIKGISSFLGDLPSFYIKQALSIPEHLAWIICPPTSYENTLEEALTRGMKRINEILDLPLFESNGKIDYRAAELIMRAVGFVDVRKHGMPTQRTEQLMRLTTQNLTRADARLVATQAPPKLEELEETIKSLERQLDGDSQEPIPVPERLING